MSQTESNSSGTRTTENASVIQGSDIYVNSREGSVNISGSQLTATEDLMLSAVKVTSRLPPAVTRPTMKAVVAAKPLAHWVVMATAPQQVTAGRTTAAGRMRPPKADSAVS